MCEKMAPLCVMCKASRQKLDQTPVRHGDSMELGLLATSLSWCETCENGTSLYSFASNLIKFGMTQSDVRVDWFILNVAQINIIVVLLRNVKYIWGYSFIN